MTARAEIILAPHQTAAEIKLMATRLGFDLVGIAPASPSKYRDYFRQWLDDGQAEELLDRPVGTAGVLPEILERHDQQLVAAL